MTALKNQVSDVFNDYRVDGLPVSGAKDPVKPDVRTLLYGILSAMDSITVAAALSSGAVVIYAAKSVMDADLAHNAGTLGIVKDDTTDANNGIYTKVGASGSGNWSNTNLVTIATIRSQVDVIQQTKSFLQVALATTSDTTIVGLAGSIAANAGQVAADKAVVASQAAAVASAAVNLAYTASAIKASTGAGVAQLAVDQSGNIGDITYSRDYPNGPGAALPFPKAFGSMPVVMGDGQSNSTGTGGGQDFRAALSYGKRFTGGTRWTDWWSTYGGTAATIGDTADLAAQASLVNLNENYSANSLGLTGLRDFVEQYSAYRAANGGQTLAQAGQAMFAFAAGLGGTPSELLIPDTAYFNFEHLQAACKNLFARAQAGNLSIGGLHLMLSQGESDLLNGSGTSTWYPETYKSNWRDILRSAESYFNGTVQGGYQNLTAAFAQMTAHGWVNPPDPTHPYANNPVIALAQLDLALSDPRVSIALPEYILDYHAGDVHRLTISHAWVAAYQARMTEEWDRTGKKPKFLRAVKAWRQGPRRAIVQYDVPVAPLVLDTAWVSDPNGAKGFEVYNPVTASKYTVSSVAVIGNGAFVEIVTSADMLGPVEIWYACTAPGSPNQPGRTSGARGCLRDSAPGTFTADFGDGAGSQSRAMTNYAVCQKIRSL